MKKIPNTLSLIALAFSVSSCAQKYQPMEVGGVPGWVMDGAVISGEPPPRRPNPNDLPDERLRGPVQFSFERKPDPVEQNQNHLR